MKQAQSRTQLPPLWAWCLFLLFLWQISLWAQNPSLMSDDSGEMITGAYTLGIPHPPGYPLYCLIGHLFSLLPIGTVAFRLNLLSCVFTLSSLIGAALAGFFYLDREEKLKPWPRGMLVAAVVLLLFFCRSVFAQSLTAKGAVYTLTLFFLSLFWFLRIKNHGKGLSNALFLFLVLIWSIGMANHWETELLWAPFLGLWCWQEKFVWNTKRVLQGLSVFLLGLSLYLYLPLRAALKPSFCWGNPIDPRELWWILDRYFMKGSEPLLRSASVYLSFLGEYAVILITHWVPFVFILAGWGLVVLYRHQKDLFYSSLAFYGPMVIAILIVPREETQFLLNVYLVASQGLMAFWFLVGFSSQSYIGIRNSLIFLFLFILMWGCWVVRQENKSQYLAASDFSINVMKQMPSRSIFLSGADNYAIPFLYEWDVVGLRKDIVFEPSIFLFHDWGWEQLKEQDAELSKAILKPGDIRSNYASLNELGKKRSIFFDLEEINENWGKSLIGQVEPWALTAIFSSKVTPVDRVYDRFGRWVDLERLRNEGQSFDPSDITTEQIFQFYAEQYVYTGRWIGLHGDLLKGHRLFEKGLNLRNKIHS